MQSDITDDRLLNREEVEARFGIPKRFLETAAARGDGPRRVQIGRLVKYRPKDVTDWIEANVAPESNQ